MEIQGLDYNTQREKLLMPEYGREKLLMPEYGREIQKMVEYAVSLPSRDERLKCAKSIVRMMLTKVPQIRENVGLADRISQYDSHRLFRIDNR